MNTALRILNVLLIAGILYTFKGLDFKPVGTAEGFGFLVGASLWLLAPVVSLFALGNDASPRLRTVAIWSNVIEGAGLLAVGIGFSSNELTVTRLIAGLLMISPFFLNVVRIRRLKAEALQSQDSELMGEQVSLDDLRIDKAAAADAWEEPEDRANYFIRHWRGQLPLPVSYWLNGALVAFGVYFMNRIVGDAFEDASMRKSSSVAIVTILIGMAAWIWSAVGIWRSAGHHTARGGSEGWASTARFIVAVGFVGFTTAFVNHALPQLKEFAAIATGHDPISRIDATLTADGTVMVLSGNFGAGSADEVARVMSSAPKLRTVSLASHGGRLGEASTIAGTVRARELDTYVESFCESACTYVFLAGAERAATPNAKIGFHRPDFPGFSADMRRQMTDKMLAVYRSHDISSDFLDRVAKTETSDMWYPTRDELIENGVINRVSLGGETRTAVGAEFRSREELGLKMLDVPLMRAIDRRYPGTLDRAADLAWEAYQKGAKDGDVLTAARKVFASVFPRLLAEADDQILVDFMDLSLAQLTAARNVSYEACAALLSASLNTSQVLPKEVNDQEVRWLLNAIESKPLARGKVDSAQFVAVATDIVSGMPAELADVISDMTAHGDEPKLQCDAMIAYYQEINRLPHGRQLIALRGMFQGTAERQ